MKYTAAPRGLAGDLLHVALHARVAFDKYCRVASGGYSGIRDVNNPDHGLDDTMQSFWVAETLKYLLLLFSDDDVLSLETSVINTEAHPLRVVPE